MDLTSRFTNDLAALLPEGVALGPLALAISGGPDSTAMLWLAAQAFRGRVIAATVDHGLRPEAAAEAELAAATCAQLGVPHLTLHPEHPIAGGNRHAAARAVRYALLAAWAAANRAITLATAHHADDQAETFLMRAVRGSGPAGLAGVRARRRDGELTIVRPLLGWRRAELLAICETAGLPFATDPSNADARFERTQVRRLLADRPWLDPAGLARAARHAGEAVSALDDITDWLWRTRRRGAPTGQIFLDLADLPRELRRRLARRALAEFAAIEPAANIELLLDALAAGRAATQADILVTPVGDTWRFAPAPARRHRE